MRRSVLEAGGAGAKAGRLSDQGKLIAAVLALLVVVNLWFTLSTPRERAVPRSVRMAQERADVATLTKGAGSSSSSSSSSSSASRGGSGASSGEDAGSSLAAGADAGAAAAVAPKQGRRSSSGSGSWWSALTGAAWGRGSSKKGGSGSEGAKPRPKPSRVPPSPSRAPASSYLTHEHCYAQSDESETCFYHGAMCYDGDHIIVVDEAGTGQDARTSMCYDFRHFVASPSCGYNGPHRRHNLPADTTPGYLKDTAPRLLSYNSDRKWGPQGREIHYRQVGPEVFTEAVDNYNEEYNVTLQWLDAPLYVGGLHHSWLDHTWHFAAATMALFDLKRYNRSAHVDYPGHPAASRLQTVGAWEAPPMDNLLIAGDYRNVKGSKDLRPWIGHLLNLLVQNQTKVLWNSVWKEQWGISKTRWLCARESVVIGLKPRMFNSIADAHVWRMMAYHYVGIQEPTKDEWPPRRITIITRIGTRNVVNMDEGVALIRSYGLEVNWITEMGLLTFEQQVEAMAKTGILMAVHGAGLANVLWMPAHSVVVEITPYVMYASMYRDLAAASGLYYYRLPSDKPDNVSAGMFYEAPWYDKCDGEDKHISSPAAFLDYECNSRSKSSPVLLNLEKLKATLELALDDIGCRDGFCMEQWWYINMKKKMAEEKAAKEKAEKEGPAADKT